MINTKRTIRTLDFFNNTARVLITFLVLGATSFGITYWLFPLSEKIELNHRDRFKISERISFKSKPSLGSAIANGFQTSLNLAWYDVYFENHNNRAIIYLGLSNTCTNKTLETTNENLQLDYNYVVNPLKSGICTISVEDESSLKRLIIDPPATLPKQSEYDFFSQIDIYARPNIHAWLAKLIIIFLIMANTVGSLGIIGWFYQKILPRIFYLVGLFKDWFLYLISLINKKVLPK